jgi:LacI family transcriptional regulator
MNESRFVAPVTKARVLAAIAELDYRRDGIARSLRRSRTGTIGAIISDITNPFFGDLFKGIEDTLQSLPETLNVILCNTEEDAEKERLYLDLLMDKRIDGLILAPAGGNADVLTALANRGFPMVFVDRALPSVPVDEVLVDNFAASEELVRHLVKQGHRRIALLRATLHADSIEQRVAGYRRALEQAGIPFKRDLIVDSASDLNSAHVSGCRLLDIAPLPNAVFCTNNFMTLGLMRAIHNRGLDTPADIAVAGFDDFPWADSFRPRITAIAQPAYEMGQVAARRLCEKIGSAVRSEPVRTLLPTQLIVRETSG